jgi:hypothetical protein
MIGPILTRETRILGLLLSSIEMSNLAILSKGVSSVNFIFAKPECMVRPKRDTTRVVAGCWQREFADLPCCYIAYLCDPPAASSKIEPNV